MLCVPVLIFAVDDLIEAMGGGMIFRSWQASWIQMC